MLDYLFSAIAQFQETVTRKREDNIVVVSKAQSASTMPYSTGIFEFIQTATTYQAKLPSSNEDIFVSPVKRSFVVTASVVIGGRVVQPPIDEDDIVYFDE